MTTDAKPYVIQPGDTVLTIALLHELEPRDIVNHDKNRAMFSERHRDPHMLAPGEIVYIPPPPAPTPSVSPRSANTFTATVPKVHLHLQFECEKGPLAGEAFRIEAPVVLTTARRRDLTQPLEGNLDGEGKVSLEVPALIGSFVLRFPARNTEHEVIVGGLDPLDQPSGVNARLTHLGFLPLDQTLADPYRFETEESAKQTLKRFQSAYQLEATGSADGRTLDALKNAHGC